jgi:hypothetical protein
MQHNSSQSCAGGRMRCLQLMLQMVLDGACLATPSAACGTAEEHQAEHAVCAHLSHWRQRSSHQAGHGLQRWR